LGYEKIGSIEGGLVTLAWLAIVVAFGADILNKVAALRVGVLEKVPVVSAPDPWRTPLLATQSPRPQS